MLYIYMIFLVNACGFTIKTIILAILEPIREFHNIIPNIRIYMLVNNICGKGGSGDTVMISTCMSELKNLYNKDHTTSPLYDIVMLCIN